MFGNQITAAHLKMAETPTGSTALLDYTLDTGEVGWMSARWQNTVAGEGGKGQKLLGRTTGTLMPQPPFSLSRSASSHCCGAGATSLCCPVCAHGPAAGASCMMWHCGQVWMDICQ